VEENTLSHEELDVPPVLLNNRSYAILNAELHRAGAAPSKEAERLFDLINPNLEFATLAQGMGVPSVYVEAAESRCRELEASYSEPGPPPIEAIL
jgi:acetolactate synthase I/II/III large subunit